MDSSVADGGEQIREGIRRARERGFQGKFIAYFQTETNTYAPMESLEAWWGLVDRFPHDLAALSVSTRPDCLPDRVIRLLARQVEKRMVWVELGLQSVHDRTLEKIRRGHDYACFLDAVRRLRAFPELYVCAHIILGLPGESREHMEETIREISRLRLEGVKIHHLQVVKNTLLAQWYREGQVRVFSEEAYIDLLVRLLPLLDSRTAVHRLVGEIRRNLLVAPRWEMPKTRIIQKVTRELEERGWFQGMRSGETGSG
jgi:radical SAM protein (TIGR01212 family)